MSKSMSFVTHHQLFKPRVLKSVFRGDKDLANWATTLEPGIGSPLSEYHLYGAALTAVKFQGDFVLSSFRNKPVSRGDFFSSGKTLSEYDCNSVSMHTYL